MTAQRQIGCFAADIDEALLLSQSIWCSTALCKYDSSEGRQLMCRLAHNERQKRPMQQLCLPLNGMQQPPQGPPWHAPWQPPWQHPLGAGSLAAARLAAGPLAAPLLAAARLDSLASSVPCLQHAPLQHPPLQHPSLQLPLPYRTLLPMQPGRICLTQKQVAEPCLHLDKAFAVCSLVRHCKLSHCAKIYC